MIEGSHLTVTHRHTTVFTDHKPLTWLFKGKIAEGRLAAWALTLQDYDFEIRYRTGKSNANADTMSRPPITPDDAVLVAATSVTFTPEVSREHVQQLQRADPQLQQMFMSAEQASQTREKIKPFCLQGGLLLHRSGRRMQLVVPNG